MKTQRIKKVTVLAIAVLMFAGSNLYAQRGRNYSTQGRGYGQGQICMMLPDLTEEQQNKIETYRLAHLKEMNTHRNQMNELRAKRQTLITSDNSDMKEINAIIDQMTSVHNKMLKTSAKHRQDVRSQLTDKQKVYFDSRPMRGQRNGRGAGYGRGNGRGYNQGAGYGQGYGQDAGYGRGYGRGLNYNTVND
ncbi:MAG: Spy/CpxP family protein refolding chaperone [Bacteroidales bacterium]|nr:Spy/CpxP family protein refolding chaperone [Bacteroidales bacterium]